MIETDRLIAPRHETHAGRGDRARAAAEAARRVRRSGKDSRPALDLHRGRAQAREVARPRAAVRPAGSGQDDARAHHRARDGREPAPDLGPGARAPGDLAAMLTNLEPNDVLFIDEIHRLSPVVEEILYPALEDFQIDIMIGEGPARALGQARPAAVHAGRRDHARRHADQSAARPLRHRRAARVLHDRGAGAHRQPLGGAARRADRRRRRASRSRAARAARRASPTGCCGACATTRRCAPTARSRARSRMRR